MLYMVSFSYFSAYIINLSGPQQFSQALQRIRDGRAASETQHHAGSYLFNGGIGRAAFEIFADVHDDRLSQLSPLGPFSPAYRGEIDPVKTRYSGIEPVAKVLSIFF
jgi:hypothetical protein